MDKFFTDKAYQCQDNAQAESKDADGCPGNPGAVSYKVDRV